MNLKELTEILEVLNISVIMENGNEIREKTDDIECYYGMEHKESGWNIFTY